MIASFPGGKFPQEAEKTLGRSAHVRGELLEVDPYLQLAPQGKLHVLKLEILIREEFVGSLFLTNSIVVCILGCFLLFACAFDLFPIYFSIESTNTGSLFQFELVHRF